MLLFLYKLPFNSMHVKYLEEDSRCELVIVFRVSSALTKLGMLQPQAFRTLESELPSEAASN